MRGKVRGTPDQDASSSVLVPETLVDSDEVLVLTPLLYQPMRVLMSVLLMPAAETRIRTSVGERVGTGRSVLYSSFSGPPCPVKMTPDMVSGIASCGICAVIVRTLSSAAVCGREQWPQELNQLESCVFIVLLTCQCFQVVLGYISSSPRYPR